MFKTIAQLEAGVKWLLLAVMQWDGIVSELAPKAAVARVDEAASSHAACVGFAILVAGVSGKIGPAADHSLDYDDGGGAAMPHKTNLCRI